MNASVATQPATPKPQGMSALTKGLVGLVVVLVVAVIVVVVLAVTGKIGKGEEEPPPPPPDEGLFSCAGIYLDPASLTEQPPFSSTLPSYTFSNKALVYVAPPPTGSTGAGPKYYLTYNPSGGVDKAVVLSATKSTEWSISPEGRITSSKAAGKCLSFSPGSSYVLLGEASVCDDNPERDVTCAFVYDGYSFYSKYYLENPEILDTAQILYWYDKRDALSITGVSLSKIGTSANCSNIGVEA